MKLLSKHPIIYEINTWVWLGELSQKCRRPVSLATVPSAEWDAIASYGFDAVWLMGVWDRSPAGRAIATRNQSLLQDFQRALTDFSPEDNVGSPYCVRQYKVDELLGGFAGLAASRDGLAQHGIRLILDFVPNHVAPDHPWVAAHPEYFVAGDNLDLDRDPASFMAAGGKILACGRDPNFPAWPDVLQLNAFHPGLRAAVGEELQRIAQLCDGVRCDMAMLVMNDIFERTWGLRAGPRPIEDYWPPLIQAVRTLHPEFQFFAEAYWDLERALQEQGFDFCYDEKLYKGITQGEADSVWQHLQADLSYQQRLVRYLENHDEPRAAAAFSGEKVRAAAISVLTLPGAKLLHEGQLEGRRVRLPVFLGRRPNEPVDTDLEAFYRRLLAEASREIFRQGSWRLCDRAGWPDNPRYRNILAWCWEHDLDRALIVVNFSDTTSQARVRGLWTDLAGRPWRLSDSLSGEAFERTGDELAEEGLFVSLNPWSCHFFRMVPLS
jgi:glycosidase